MKHTFDKCWAAILTTAFFLLLCACGGTEKTTTYTELSEENRQIVDFVYSNLSQWETSDTSEVTFSKSDEEIKLMTFDLKSVSSATRSWGGYINAYTFDVDSACFECEDSTYAARTAYTHDGSAGGYTKVWNVDWTEAEKKDYLAHKLADNCSSGVGFGVAD